jgi:hypothetical protein
LRQSGIPGFGVGEITHLEGLHAVEEGAGRVPAERIHVSHVAGGAGGVPFLAAGDTGMTTHANIQVYNER